MKKIVIIGASYLQIPLIKKAREMGIETHVFAWEQGATGKDFADFFYPISIIEKDQILDICKNIKPAGILSIASDLAMTTVNYIGEKFELICNSLKCNELTTNKFLMRNALHSARLPCPRYFRLNQQSDIDKSKVLKLPFIIKPTDRSGSRGVTKVTDYKHFNDAIQSAFTESINKEIIIEEFVEGREISVEMISWEGEHQFIACTDKVTTGSPGFVEIEHHQPAQLSKAILLKVIEIVKKSLKALNVSYGASHTELIITANEDIFLVEIGARMGGDHIGAKLVELSTGYDFVKAVIDVALGIPPEVELVSEHYSGICFITPEPGEVIQILDNTKLFSEITESEISVKPSDLVAELNESANRVGYYLYKSTKEKFSAGNVQPIIVKTTQFDTNC